jgi:hypothetical protein
MGGHEAPEIVDLDKHAQAMAPVRLRHQSVILLRHPRFGA